MASTFYLVNWRTAFNFTYTCSRCGGKDTIEVAFFCFTAFWRNRYHREYGNGMLFLNKQTPKPDLSRDKNTAQLLYKIDHRGKKREILANGLSAIQRYTPVDSGHKVH